MEVYEEGQKPPAVHKVLNLHGISASDLGKMVRTGEMPDDKLTDRKQFVEGS